MDFAKVIRANKQADGVTMITELPRIPQPQTGKAFVEMPHGQVSPFNVGGVDSVLARRSGLDSDFDTCALRWRIWRIQYQAGKNNSLFAPYAQFHQQSATPRPQTRSLCIVPVVFTSCMIASITAQNSLSFRIRPDPRKESPAINGN